MTPTVLRDGAYSVVIHTRDNVQHHRPHVHVAVGDGEAVIFLGDTTTPPSPGEARGLKSSEERGALRLIIKNQAALLAEWASYHG